MNPPSNRGRNWHNSVYFGLHYDLHAGMDDTELGAALTPEHLRAELAKIGPDWVQCDCKGHPGITSWPTKIGTPSPGIVRDALRIHRAVTRELGIPLIMHYSGVWDSRAIELHSDWARVGPSGKPEGSVGSTCNLGPYTRELMIPQLIELIDEYGVDGFWVDGENWATQPCYCARCLAAFEAQTGIANPPKAPGEPNWEAWAQFHRTIFVEHVRTYTNAVHEHAPDVTVCSNWMYTFGQPDAVDAPIDYISGDYTWKWSIWGAMFEGRFIDSRRLTNPGLSWDLMAWAFTTGQDAMEGWTFKHAPGLCQEAAVVISLGGAVSFYSTPQRNGHLSGWQHDQLAEAARFARARQPWCEGAESVPQAAILHNSAHWYAGTGETLMGSWSQTTRPVIGALHALLENHIPVDILAEDALEARANEYPLIVVPEQTRIGKSLMTKLEAYVRGGGRLIVSGTDVATTFGKLAGIEPIPGEANTGYLPAQIGDETTTVKGPWQPVTVVGDTARATHWVLSGVDPAFNEKTIPVATISEVGKGRIAAIPGALFDHFAATHYPRTRRLIGEIVGGLAPDLLVRVDAPPRVHVILRRKPLPGPPRSGEGVSNMLIVHLLNTGTGHPLSPSSVMVEDIPRVGPIRLAIRRAEKPARVYLAPGMEPLTWDWANGTVNVAVESIGILDSVVIE